MSYHQLEGFWDFFKEGPATQAWQQGMVKTYMEDPSKKNDPEFTKYLLDEDLINPDGTLTQKGHDRYNPIEAAGELVSDVTGKISGVGIKFFSKLIPWWVWVGGGLAIYLAFFRRNPTVLKLVDKIT